MSVIRVAAEVLSAKESRMRTFSVDYGLALQANFNAGPVDEAYDKVNGRWKESQVELTTSIDNIANLLKSIREAFEDVENKLVESLAPGTPGASTGGLA